MPATARRQRGGAGKLIVHMDEISASTYSPTGSHKVLWDYWCELQKGADVAVPPYRSMRPSRLVSIMPKLALSDYIDKDTQKIRLIGGGHDSLWPKEAIGANLFDFVDPQTAKGRKHIYHEMITRPCGCFSDEVAVTTTGKRVRYRGLFLPMLDKNAAPHIFIGVYDVSAEGFDLEEASREGVVSRFTHEAFLINL